MAELADMSITNAASGAVLFEVQHKEGYFAAFQDSSPATANLFQSITLSMRKPKPGVNRKVTVKVTCPYEVSVGSETVTKSVTAILDIIVPDDAPATQIADMRKFVEHCVSNAAATALIRETVETGKFPY